MGCGFIAAWSLLRAVVGLNKRESPWQEGKRLGGIFRPSELAARANILLAARNIYEHLHPSARPLLRLQMSLPPELEERLQHLASLRIQLRQLHGALASQQPGRRAEERLVARGADELRSELAGLRSSIDARRSRLQALQHNQVAVDHLANAVVDAARSVSVSIEQRNEEAAVLARASREQGERLLRLRARQGLRTAAPPQQASAAERAEQLEAARERMRRRGARSPALRHRRRRRPTAAAAAAQRG